MEKELKRRFDHREVMGHDLSGYDEDLENESNEESYNYIQCDNDE